MTERLVDDVCVFLLLFFAVGLLWQVLEVLFYGEVQPRAVDNIIALAWVALIVKAYLQGFRNGIDSSRDGAGRR